MQNPFPVMWNFVTELTTIAIHRLMRMWAVCILRIPIKMVLETQPQPLKRVNNRQAVDNDLDCNDTDALSYPDATERCDGLDNDCDEEIDEEIPAVWFLDADGDGFGSTDQQTSDCNPVSGYITVSGDCDDGDAMVNPNAQEVCDGIDNDCDSLTDDSDDSTDVTSMSAWYLDADNDTYGSTTVVAVFL